VGSGKQKNKAYQTNDTPYSFYYLILTAARAVENENKKNDNDDPSKSIVFEEVTQTSHNKPPSLSAFFD